MERIIGINPVTEALLNKEKNIEKLDSEKQKQIDNLVHQIEELLKEQK